MGNAARGAFTDDPLWGWVLARPGADDRRARLEKFWRAVIGKVYARHELVFVARDDAGVHGAAAWAPPDRWKFSFADEARVALPVLASFGVKTARLLELMIAVERRHLREPHYYLFAIGADPAKQGQGVGASLLGPMLARIDDERMPAYLESSNPRNVPFYRRHGFIETGEIHLGDAQLTLMRRPPRS